MSDEEARFAACLARQVGRLDWWNVRNEHTPYEWTVQRLLYEVDPFGERRHDLRAAINTLFIRNATVEMTEDDAREMLNSLTKYLPCHQNDKSDFDPVALQRMNQNAAAR